MHPLYSSGVGLGVNIRMDTKTHVLRSDCHQQLQNWFIVLDAISQYYKGGAIWLFE